MEPIQTPKLNIESFTKFIERNCPILEDAQRLMKLNNCMSFFKDYWFGREAKVTNNHLMHVDIHIHNVIDALCSETKDGQKILTMMYILEKIDEAVLKNTLKIPSSNHSTPEKREELSASKEEALEAWKWIRNKYELKKYKETEKDTWQRFKEIYDKYWVL
jgi:hypothetical protein